MSDDDDILIKALRDLPTPQPRPGFADRALAHAARVAQSPARRPRLLRPEIWFAAVAGGAVAAALTWFMVRPLAPATPHGPGIALAVNEARNIEVLIDSERDLPDATIRVTLTGGVVLDGFENERQIDWRAHVERGPNVLALPVVARTAGAARLVAVIEHEGRTRTVAVNLNVKDTSASES